MLKGTASMKLEFSNVINPVQKHCLKDYKELPNIVNAVRWLNGSQNNTIYGCFDTINTNFLADLVHRFMKIETILRIEY